MDRGRHNLQVESDCPRLGQIVKASINPEHLVHLFPCHSSLLYQVTLHGPDIVCPALGTCFEEGNFLVDSLELGRIVGFVLSELIL